MKKIVMTLIGACLLSSACAQEAKPIKLNEPDKNRGKATMQAFEQRRSTREFADRELSLQDLSDLLWAANGINRPAEGKRTAPSAMNMQEIDIYACFATGAYLYNAKTHELEPVTPEDVRPHIAGSQDFAKTAPVCLLIVSDLGRVRGGDTENGRIMTACDAGIVSQNISLFCAGCDLATVPRGFMEKDKLAESLKLRADQLPVLNHPVGYFK